MEGQSDGCTEVGGCGVRKRECGERAERTSKNTHTRIPACATTCCRRDEALSAIQIAMREQQQQELSIESEIQGYKKDIIKQQINNEALTAVLKKVEAESQFVSKQIETMVEKQSMLQEVREGGSGAVCQSGQEPEAGTITQPTKELPCNPFFPLCFFPPPPPPGCLPRAWSTCNGSAHLSLKYSNVSSCPPTALPKVFAKLAKSMEHTHLLSPPAFPHSSSPSPSPPLVSHLNQKQEL